MRPLFLTEEEKRKRKEQVLTELWGPVIVCVAGVLRPEQEEEGSVVSDGCRTHQL